VILPVPVCGRRELRHLGDEWTEAEREILGGYAILAKQTSPSVSWLKAARTDLALVYDSLGRPAEAAKYREVAAK
jgi:hypothetical protein